MPNIRVREDLNQWQSEFASTLHFYAERTMHGVDQCGHAEIFTRASAVWGSVLLNHFFVSSKLACFLDRSLTGQINFIFQLDWVQIPDDLHPISRPWKSWICREQVCAWLHFLYFFVTMWSTCTLFLHAESRPFQSRAALRSVWDRYFSLFLQIGNLHSLMASVLCASMHAKWVHSPVQ